MSLCLLLQCSAGAREQKTKKNTLASHKHAAHRPTKRPSSGKNVFFFSFYLFFSPPPESKQEAVQQTGNYGRKPFISCAHQNGKSARQRRKSNANLRGWTQLLQHAYGCYWVEWLLRKLPFLFSPTATLHLFFCKTIWNSNQNTTTQLRLSTDTCWDVRQILVSSLHPIRSCQSASQHQSASLEKRGGWSYSWGLSLVRSRKLPPASERFHSLIESLKEEQRTSRHLKTFVFSWLVISCGRKHFGLTPPTGLLLNFFQIFTITFHCAFYTVNLHNNTQPHFQVPQINKDLPKLNK